MSKAQKFSIEARKEEDFPTWYRETLTKGEILDYHDISGCYVLRPNGFFVWKKIREDFDERIAAMGVEEAYFPMLVSKDALEKEKQHVDNFSPEVAWITECGGKRLELPVAIRPTSETIIYPYFAKWIQSYRDLPMKVNQWCNVLRWETTQTTPFIRSREFLWQEGHTAHFSKEDADKEVLEILDHYAEVYEELLAVPVIKGRKSKKETFAGADYTTTVEAFIPATGRGIQAATSHSLGTNFSRMFKVLVEDPQEPGQHVPVFQNSWGLSTRSIGICIMVHSDDRGLVLPPMVAPVQAVVIPCGITKSTTDAEKAALESYVCEVERALRDDGVRAKLDSSTNVSPGHKFNHWEVRGVPLRIEIGPKDMKDGSVTAVWRHSGERKTLEVEAVGSKVRKELGRIQQEMFARARAARDARMAHVESMEGVLAELVEKRLVMFSWCATEECEDGIKLRTTVKDADGAVVAMGAKSLCIPFDTQGFKQAPNCLHCGEPSTCIGIFGRSY